MTCIQIIVSQEVSETLTLYIYIRDYAPTVVADRPPILTELMHKSPYTIEKEAK